MKLVLVPVAVALAIAVLTPLGDGVREFLFPTKAALTGSITMAGRAVEGAVVALDGVDSGRTDQAGAYLITGVGKGSHVVEARAVGAHPGQATILVQRGDAEVKSNPVDLTPLVELGYTITSLDLQPSGQRGSTGFVLKYNFTLWIHGDAATLHQVTTVSYALPAPFTPSAVSSTSSDTAFCYRQAGSLSFDRIMGSPGLGAASSTVSLNNGQSFAISGQAANLPPPPCTATEAGTKDLPTGQAPPPPSGQPTPPPPPPAPTLPTRSTTSSAPSTTSTTQVTTSSTPQVVINKNDFVGKSFDEATGILEGAGWKDNQIKQATTQGKEAAGTVINITPTGKVDVGTPITLTVSDGKAAPPN